MKFDKRLLISIIEMCKLTWRNANALTLGGRSIMETLTLPSCAKINLGLHITGKREDGYHNIHTVFQEIDFCDTLTFQKIDAGIQLTASNPALPLDHRNLVAKAFLLMQNKYKFSGGIKVHIDKKVPAGAGLGGGSSNASTTLKAVNRLWRLNLTDHVLMELAAEIGSDVAFFIQGGTMLGEGRGEILYPLPPLNACWIVLLCPNIHVSTAWAYGEMKITLTNAKKIINFSPLFQRSTPDGFKANLINDFEGVVFQRHPVLQLYKERLYEEGAFYASMSGSGSSLFGFFQNYEEAFKASQKFISDLTTIICRPISVSSS